MDNSRYAEKLEEMYKNLESNSGKLEDAHILNSMIESSCKIIANDLMVDEEDISKILNSVIKNYCCLVAKDLGVRKKHIKNYNFDKLFYE